MADAEYRHELELELERLTKELAHVRVEKAQQRQRIEHLQLEQTQLQDQLMGQNKTDTNGDNNKNNKELRTDLAQHLHSLHQVVRQKKSEHVKVKQEWERSQEQCNHLKQTVGVVLQGTTTVASFSTDDDDDDDDDDSSLQGDDLDNRQAQSRDIVQNLMGSFLVENSSLMSNLAEETHYHHHHHVTTTAAAAAVASRLEEASLCDSAFDNDTVITEHTKDSLHLYRNKQMKRSRRTTAARQTAPEGGGGGLSKFFSKQEAAAPPSASAPPKVATTSKGNSRNKLGNFLDNEGKKPPKEKKDLKSASE